MWCTRSCPLKAKSRPSGAQAEMRLALHQNMFHPFGGTKNWSKLECLLNQTTCWGVSDGVIDRSFQPPQIPAISCHQPPRCLRCNRGLRIGNTVEAARSNDLDAGGFRADQESKGCDQCLRLRACCAQERAASAFRLYGLGDRRRDHPTSKSRGVPEVPAASTSTQRCFKDRHEHRTVWSKIRFADLRVPHWRQQILSS